MREQVEFLKRPPDEVWEAMCQWLEHHGVRGASMPAWSLWFDRCEETRRIRYPEVVFGVDPASGPQLPPGVYAPRVDGVTVVVVVRTVQLEAAPSPFPRLAGRFHYACVRPELAAALTVPPTWPALGRVVGLEPARGCGPG